MLLGKTGKRYSFMKKPEGKYKNTTSLELSLNEVMEAVMTGENDFSSQDVVCIVTDEHDLMELFDQFSGLMSPMSD